MPTFKSIQLIEDIKQQTEDILNKAVTQWQMLPPRTMLYKESADKWSAAQCLMHLNSYGDYYLPALQNSIEEAKRKEWRSATNFTTSFIGNWFTKLMQPKGEAKTIKKMKSPKNHSPITNENSDIVLATFIDQQETLLQLLEKAKEVDLRKAKTPVSISRFIKLPLGDTFRFLIAHNYRHVLQADRAISSATKESVAI